MIHRSLTAIAAALFLTATAAPAATLSASEYLSQFSIVTSGDLDTNQDNYGRAYVGGNLVTSSGKADFANRTLPSSPFAALTVEGDVTGNNAARVGNGGTTMVVGGSVRNGELQFANTNDGEVLVGGTVSSGTRINNRERPGQNGIRVVEGLSGDPVFEARFATDIFSALAGLSSDLSGLAANAAAAPNRDGNRLVFSGVGSGLSVFNIAAGDFGGSINDLSFSLGATETMIVNVSGTHVTIADNLNGLQHADGQRIIWNFYEAERLDIQRQMFGSILAMDAHVTNNTAIEGSLFARSATLRGQVHLQPFAGELPEFSQPDAAVSAVPLPATLPALILAVAALLGLRRRGRAA